MITITLHEQFTGEDFTTLIKTELPNDYIENKIHAYIEKHEDYNVEDIIDYIDNLTGVEEVETDFINITV